jgi:hypothetical protein
MTTLQIIGNSPDAMKFLEFARTLPFIREKLEEKPVELTPPCQYTVEEMRKGIRQAIDDYRATGITYPQEEIERWIGRL